ncbi:hypothetical protein HN604_01130 [archaeon]|jgi:hypothetical protein|nr:hypothetical protein [archaeon]MBT6182909.1 hypothetical protein [archaeon]MBT6606780.1 hypothetical protein [archaeon]MBT7251747.1 hypothetical protein [archaeon]MBT7660666.1 hypothetical protein [archaeon]
MEGQDSYRNKVLVGLHENATFGRSLHQTYERIAVAKGFECDFAQDVSQMLRLSIGRSHRFYAMDLNLGNPGGEDLLSAQSIYQIIHPRMREKEAYFIGLSGSQAIVDRARELRIPAELKSDFSFAKFLDQGFN